MRLNLNRSQLGTFIRLGLSVVLLVVLFSIIDGQQFIGHLMHINPAYYIIGLLCYFGFIALWSLRWHFILRAAGERIGYRRVFTTTLVGNFFAMFLPEAVGSDLARMSEVSDEQRPRANIVSTVLLDRLIGLVSIILMALVALLFGSHFLNDSSIFLTIGGLLAALVAGWVLFFNRRFMGWWFDRLFKLPLVSRFENGIRKLYEALYHLHNQPGLLIAALLLALLVQVVEVISIIFLAQGSGTQVSPVYFFIFLPIIWLLTTLPISISGLGVREGAFAFFFAQVGVSSPEAVALSLLYYSFRVVSGLAGGLIFLRASLGVYLRKRRALASVPQA